MQRIDTSAKHLGEFLAWLLSGNRQADMPGGGRSFRRRCQGLWEVWPLAPVVDEVHEVVFVDGIHLGRKAVVLIAQSRDFILGWYVARSENSRAWEALMNRIAPPDVVVTDGGSGFEKARKKAWPNTRVAVHLSRVRDHQTSHHHWPQACSLQGTVRLGQAALARERPRASGLMDRHLLGLVQALGGLPRAEDQEGRWRVAIHARTTRAGPQQCESAHRSRGVVHLHRPPV